MDADLDGTNRINEQLRPPVAEVRAISAADLLRSGTLPIKPGAHEDGSQHGNHTHPAGTKLATAYTLSTPSSGASVTSWAFQIALPAPEVGTYASNEIIEIVKLDGTRE